MSDKKSPVYRASADDPALAAAMVRARATFKYLWRELTWEYRRIVPALDLAAVKAAFKDDRGDDVEHMWLGEIAFDGDHITATLLNDPNDLKSVSAGDRITLAPEELEDWMYVSGGHVYGAFTVHAMRAKMSPAERRGHDEAWGFEFGDPSRVEVVPAWAPPAPADPDAEHPMSENMAPTLADAIDADPTAFLTKQDARGFTMLHSLALGGSAACVRVLLSKGASPSLRTKSGKTAGDLAQQMGWTRVVDLLHGTARA